MTADYSQVEMRIMAHLSEDDGLIEAFNSGEDLHTTMASRVFEVAPDAVTPEMRSRIKAMSYGLAYGLSAYGLSQQLGVGPDEAKALMDDYFERFGGVRDYLASVVDDARRTGYTETLLGRRRYLPDLTSDNRQRREMAERMALNAPIQGSAADIVKVAMLAVERRLRDADLGSRLLLQVHDELVLEVAAGEEERGRCPGRGGDARCLPALGRARHLGRLRPHLARRRALGRPVGDDDEGPWEQGAAERAPAAPDRWSFSGFHGGSTRRSSCRPAPTTRSTQSPTVRWCST